MTPTTETTRTETRRRFRLSGLELILGGAYVAVLLVLVAIEPDILQAPFESTRAVVVTFGGAVLAVAAIMVMMRLGVPPVVRVLVVGIPLVLASWWLLEPFFVDDEVQEEFSTSIAAARREPQSRTEPTATTTAPVAEQGATAAPTTTPTTAPAPTGPQLLGSGTFVGLAGHDGTGDAGIFRLEDGSHVVRLENLDIDNGPDLQLYVVPGAEAYSPGDGSVHLGALKGNVGNQTYEIPADFEVTPGPWTVLVWCEAFTVEFVGATLEVG